jgi:citrate/tricarballylate utilization protein
MYDEGARLMRVCNACRYCEGFCAVFPAMERRPTLTESDLDFLANLCHDCGECLDACQYAPPHEFGVDVPEALAAIRLQSYRTYAWPAWPAALLSRPRITIALTAVGIPLAFLGSLAWSAGPAAVAAPHADEDGAFYALMSNATMTAAFAAPAILAAVALAVGLIRCWRDWGLGARPLLAPGVFALAVSDALGLRYLGAGGPGCAYPRETPSEARRVCHHLTFYGFLLCLASTITAAVYHHGLGWTGPYALSSAPVVLGCLGGAGLLLGPAGFLWLERRRTVDAGAPSRRSDRTLSALIFLIALSGFLLMALRESAAMGVALALHLGLVFGFFLTMPYGRLVHGLYRFCALLRNALEERRA